MHKDSITGTAGALAANCIFGLSYYFSRMALDTGTHPLVILQIHGGVYRAVAAGGAGGDPGAVSGETAGQTAAHGGDAAAAVFHL